jgi:hypothetical protein
MIVVLLFILLAAFFYLLPAIIAQSRKVPNTGSIWVINIFLGWTMIGWIVALAMAGRSANPMPIRPVFPPAQPSFIPGSPSQLEQPGDPASGGSPEVYGADAG